MFECYSYKTQLGYYNKEHISWFEPLMHFTSTVYYYSHKKEVEHKCFLPCDFQIVLWARNLLMFSFIVFIFWILVFFCLKIGVNFTFLQTFFFHYIIPENFTCIFTYHIFNFKKLDHFQFLQENAALKWKKKTK